MILATDVEVLVAEVDRVIGSGYARYKLQTIFKP
jgi:hypothetical protein